LNLPALSGAKFEAYLVKNIATNPVTIDPNGAEQIEGAATITLYRNDIAMIWPANANASWRAAIQGANYAFNAVSPLFGLDYFTDCVPNWVSNTSVSFSAGFGVFSGKRHILPALTKTMSTFVAGNNNGMLDTGAIGASKTYFLFGIRNISTGDCDYLASLSLTPAVPSGWELNNGARVGIIMTNGSSQIIQFDQVGNRCLFSNVVNMFSGSGSSSTQLVTFPSIPLGISVDA